MGFAARWSAGPLVLGILLFGAAPAEDPLPAIAVAAGHPAGLHLRAARSLRRDNRTSIETLDADGPRRLVRACRDGLCTGVWNDGSEVRAFGINGVPLPDRRLDAPAERTLNAILSTSFAEAGFDGIVRRLPDDGPLHRWRVEAPAGTPLVAVADRAARLVAIESPDGSRTPVSATAEPGGAVLYAMADYDAAERVTGRLGPPPGLRTLQGSARDVPLAGPLPIVPCRIDGRAARCLLDTGTTPSAVTLAFAERLEREPHGEITMTALGEYVTGAIDVAEIGLGDTRIDGVQLAVVPTTRGLDFDVVIGADVLAQLRIELQPARRVVRIGPSAGALDGERIPIAFHDGVPIVDAMLDGRPAIPLIVDTGDDGLISIGYDVYRRDPAMFVPRGSANPQGFGGIASALEGELARANVGPLTIAPAAIRAVRGEEAGHIGYALAARCGRLTIDLPERLLACAQR